MLQIRLELPAALLLLCGGSSSGAPRRSSTSSSLSYPKPRHHRHHQLIIRTNHYHGRRPHSLVCNSQSKGDHELRELSDGDDDYLKAVILMAETIRCRQINLEIFHAFDEIEWRQYIELFPLSDKMEELLNLYKTTTIFLKVFNGCDGDCLLPIAVGEGVVERLIRLSLADEVSADQFQLMRSIVGKPGYQVKWVHITKRVDKPDLGNANICFHKPGAEDIKVAARLSDAIILGKQFGSPIYVSKQIVQRYGVNLRNTSTGIFSDKESIYEVYLDSAIDGPDILAEEFDLVSKMYLAVKEERYTDAAIWRDKLLKLYTLKK